MSSKQRRRRGVVLLMVALACGGLAASDVSDRVGEVERRVGVPVPVVVAARDIEPGAELSAPDLRVSQIPSRYAPRDAPTSPAQAIGLRTAGPVAGGSPITAGVVGGPDGPGGLRGLRRGERAVEVAVSASSALADGALPGGRVDILVSTEGGDGPARSFLALEDVELLALGPAPGTDDGFDTPDAEAGVTGPMTVATLRVTLAQAVYLTAAQNFSRELRLLPRPRGDRRRIGRAAVLASEL
jgi:pilus assembly protein CpaB